MKPPKALAAYMAAIGKKGGETKGVSKRRSKEHYERLAAMKRKKKGSPPPQEGKHGNNG